jgi:hypothetical protein
MSTTVGFLFYPRSVATVHHSRRGSKQVFGHTALLVGGLVYECQHSGTTQWYDAEQYVTRNPPFMTVVGRLDDAVDVEKATAGLISNLRYSPRHMMEEIRDNVEEPAAVTCTFGGRTFLRNLGLKCNARTPDELLQRVLCLSESVSDGGEGSDVFREVDIAVNHRGLMPDSLFARQGRCHSGSSLQDEEDVEER